jgi:hypothetical protein
MTSLPFLNKAVCELRERTTPLVKAVRLAAPAKLVRLYTGGCLERDTVKKILPI